MGVCKTTDIRLLFPYVASLLGAVYTAGGRTSEGMQLLEQAVAAHSAMRLMSNRSFLLGLFAEALLLAGRPNRALEVATSALDFSRELKERGWEARMLFLLAEIASWPSSPDCATAEHNYGEALALAVTLQMRLLEASCYLGLARLHAARGDHTKADDHRARGTEMFRSMDLRVPSGSESESRAPR